MEKMLKQKDLVTLMVPILQKYPVKKAAIFGSYARQEPLPSSDLDLLLDLGTNSEYPYVDYIYGLIGALESRLNVPVDCITVRGLSTSPSAQFRENVQRECVWFYEA
jgi:predicted nucleotidyltransferase